MQRQTSRALRQCHRYYSRPAPVDIYNDKNITIMKEPTSGAIFTKRGFNIAVVPITKDNHNNILLFKKSFTLHQSATRKLEPVISLVVPTVHVSPKNSSEEQDPVTIVQNLINNSIGYTPNEVTPLAQLYNSPESSSEITYVYMARNMGIATKDAEETKKWCENNNVSVETWNILGLYDEIKKGSQGTALLNDSVTVGALAQLLMYRQSELETGRIRARKVQIAALCFVVGLALGLVYAYVSSPEMEPTKHTETFDEMVARLEREQEDDKKN